MGNDVGKQLEPNYKKEDFWLCGPVEMDYTVPPTEDKKEEYLTKKIEAKVLTDDPEYDKDKVLLQAQNIMKPFLDGGNNVENQVYVFYCHHMSPLTMEDKKESDKVTQNNDDISFDACIHASLFRLVDGNCTVYSPKYRMSTAGNNKGKKPRKGSKANKQEAQNFDKTATDIHNAFIYFAQMIKSEDQVCPFIVAGQGISSKILFDALLHVTNVQLQSQLIGAFLPGFNLNNAIKKAGGKNVWFLDKLKHWQTFSVNDSNRFIFEDNNFESEEKGGKEQSMTNPITMNNALSARADENVGSLVRDIGKKECYFEYHLCKCNVGVNKSNIKGVILTGHDKRLEESFSNVESEYLLYWLAIRQNVKQLCQVFYKNTLPVLIQKAEKAKKAQQKPADFDDL